MNHRAVRNGTPLRHDTPNLAKEARKLGYDPLLFGYTDTTLDPRVADADDPRLTTYEEVMPGFREVAPLRQDTDDRLWHEAAEARGFSLPEGWEKYRPTGNSPKDPAVYGADVSDTAVLTDAFLSHMKDAEPGWFAHLAYIRPHPPFVAPAPYNSMYAATDMPDAAKEQENESHPFLTAAQNSAPVSNTVVGFPDLEASPETTATLRSIYLGLASEVDHHIGRVIDWLKESGQYDETVLVVTSDHGEMLGDFELWGKSTYHDSAYHIPLIVRAPDHQHGVEFTEMTESIDVTPTILDLIGAEIPASVDGRSLTPLLTQKSPPWREHTFSEFDFGDPIRPSSTQRRLGLHSDHCNLAVLRTKDFKLVHFAGELPQLLFAANDETRNIAEVPDMQPTVLDLSRKMLSHRMMHADGTFSTSMATPEGIKTGTY